MNKPKQPARRYLTVILDKRAAAAQSPPLFRIPS
jgi:hypothetical protein